jgi:Reverse transcriptase (RNA-dependent DNA polymerase)
VAVCILNNDLVRSIDMGHVTALVILDLGAAFDTMDHELLIEVLKKRFAIDGVALNWFKSYFDDRTQTFMFGDVESVMYAVNSSVPQRSVLGPLEFVAYTEDVVEIMSQHQLGLRHHIYADDTQLYAHSALEDIRSILLHLQSCFSEARELCTSLRLLIWFGSRANLTKLASSDCSLFVGGNITKPSTTVRDLGVSLDSEISLKQHVNKVVSSCYYHIRRLRQVSHCVGQDVMKQLASAFILSRLDHCNSILAGLPKSTIATLQRVQKRCCTYDVEYTSYIEHIRWSSSAALASN